jgi:outer membrane receptor protein involved in Fe transport
MRKCYFLLLAYICLIVWFLPSEALAQEDMFQLPAEDILELAKKNETLKDLLNVEVTSASNTAEKISNAPASILVITKEQIKQRGYRNLVDVLEDLPGMDLSIAYGDTYYKAYWRGYRNTIGDPFLLMIDGLIFNELYFNQTRTLISIPLSYIEQIEVVYGPASSVYGANASMGVINIITRKSFKTTESGASGNITMSDKGYTWADMNYFYQKDKFRLSIAGKMERGDLNQRVNNNDFYWLRDELYNDRKLWGKFVDNPSIAGKFSSPMELLSIDARAQIDKIEMGVQFFENNTGYGTIYPADKVQNLSRWNMYEASLFGRYTTKITDKLASRTLLRYRSSGLNPESQYLEGYNVQNSSASPTNIGGALVPAGQSVRVLDYSYWQTQNRSYSFFQDIDWEISSKFFLKTGLKFENKDLQKAYDINYSDAFFPDSLKNINLAYPAPVSPNYRRENRITWLDRGIYAQLRYNLTENDIFNVGLRLDHNSSYQEAFTIRAGYIRKFEHLLLKAFYGESFQEPTPRLLYGGWKGSGSDPNLKPELSRTLEIIANYTVEKMAHNLNVYYVNVYNTIVSFPGGATNIGERAVLGLDYQLQAVLPWFKKTEVWAFYSATLMQEEKQFNAQKEVTGTGMIGDLATHKVYFGINSAITDRFNINLRGRYIGERKTITSNPVGKVNPFLVADLTLTYQNSKVRGMGFSLGCTNLFNTQYFHAGLREADTGVGGNGSGWDGLAWNGSQGWYNSLLPQPRRMIFLSLLFRL